MHDFGTSSVRAVAPPYRDFAILSESSWRPPWLIRGWKMLGNALGALVALLGLFGVSAVVCAIVWTLCAWSGRWYDWLLSFVTPLGSHQLRPAWAGCSGWFRFARL